MPIRALLAATAGVLLVCGVIRLLGVGDDMTHRAFWGSVAAATLFFWAAFAEW
jgi:hypothetical protein